MIRLLAVLVLAGASVNAQTNTSGFWQYTVSGGQATITGYTGSGGAVVMPDQLDGITVKEVAPNLFSSQTNLIQVTIPNTVTNLGGSIFRGCSNLTNVILPTEISYLPSRLFENCVNLRQVNVPPGVNVIRDSAFSGCTRLTNIVIPPGVVSIWDSAFQNCSSLPTVALPSNLTYIGDYAFYNCASLVSLTVPTTVTNLGSSVFRDCTSLTNVSLSVTLTNLPEFAFFNCQKLPQLSIPHGVTTIGANALAFCNSLTNVIIPATVTTLGASAFNHCYSLERIVVPASVASLGSSLFFFCSSLGEVIFLGNAPFVSGTDWSSCPATIYVAQSASGWGETFAGRPVVMNGAFFLNASGTDSRGSIVRNPPDFWHPSGANISLTAVPLVGYIFAGWTGDFVTATNPLVFTMDTNKVLLANFEPDSRDSDGDGLSNHQEAVLLGTDLNSPETQSPVPGLYLASQYQANWTNGRTAGRSEVTNTPNSFGLYTTNQIHNLGLGGIVLNRNTNNQLVLNYQVLQSTDLQNWSPYQQAELLITNATSDKMFLRVQAIENVAIPSQSYPLPAQPEGEGIPNDGPSPMPGAPTGGGKTPPGAP